MTDSPENSKTSLGFLLLFAASGQFFISQSHLPYTLWVGLFFYALALWELHFFPVPDQVSWGPLSPQLEVLLIGLTLALGCFLRLYHVVSLPAGMHSDQGFIGLCALRIEHEGWRPFDQVFNFQIPEVLLFYQLAAWFHLVGDSLFHFHLFFTFEALAGMGLFYGTFRQLSGPRTALLSLLILAVLRWNWIETRTGYPSSEVILYLFGALCFWVWGLQKQKTWAWMVSAFFMGIGLYTYQAFKLVPFLFLIYALEALRKRAPQPIRLFPLLSYLFIVLVLAFPLLHYMWQQKTLGNREADVFIGNEIIQQKSLKPLLRVVAGNALMFNRKGDENARQNIPGQPMLDDTTGVLFILGLGLAFYRRKNRDAFYALAGFGVLSLADLLSTDLYNSNRLVVLTAFVAYFTGSFLNALWDTLDRLFPSHPKKVIAFIVFLLTAITAQNVYTYFVEQARNEACRWSLGVEQEMIGETIGNLQKKYPGRFHYFITPFYFDNHVVRFLGYQGMAQSSPLNLTALSQGDFPKNKNAVFFLEEYKTAAFQFLKTLFPMGRETLLKNPQGQILLYRYDVSVSQLQNSRKWDRGLEGVYWNSLHEQGRPVMERQDPVLNFTSKYDFPFQNYPPFSIRWTGKLLVPVSGPYHIRLLTTDQAALWINGHKIFDTAPLLNRSVFLHPGAYSIRIQYQKNQGDSMAAHLIWMPPHQTQWEVVPATDFGKLPN